MVEVDSLFNCVINERRAELHALEAAAGPFGMTSLHFHFCWCSDPLPCSHIREYCPKVRLCCDSNRR
jgi:hypothetical protein